MTYVFSCLTFKEAVLQPVAEIVPRAVTLFSELMRSLNNWWNGLNELSEE